ncbi:MAG TPA: hypothetical protein VEA16_08840 [Vicinamibacterales bacterium]|nr:hypothetical protein [Vicinamibacterales bacterium]
MDALRRLRERGAPPAPVESRRNLDTDPAAQDARAEILEELSMHRDSPRVMMQPDEWSALKADSLVRQFPELRGERDRVADFLRQQSIVNRGGRSYSEDSVPPPDGPDVQAPRPRRTRGL